MIAFNKHNNHIEFLLQELYSLLRQGNTKKLSSTDGNYHRNPYFDNLVNSLSAKGSGNYNPVAYAIRLATGFQPNVTKNQIKKYIAASFNAFMGAELLSRNYGPCHLFFWLACYRYGDVEIKAGAFKWLRMWYLLNRSMSNYQGRCLIFGQRSVGHKINPWFLDWQLDRALGISDGSRFVNYKASSNDKQWRDFHIFELIDDGRMAVHMNDILSLHIEDVITEIIALNIKLRVPYHFVYNPGFDWSPGDWQYAWCDRSINGHTGAILAMYSDANGNVEMLPKNYAKRMRRNDLSTCKLEIRQGQKVLVFDGKRTGHHEQAVPSGGIEFSI